jgi:hypothetical protein
MHSDLPAIPTVVGRRLTQGGTCRLCPNVARPRAISWRYRRRVKPMTLSQHQSVVERWRTKRRQITYALNVLLTVCGNRLVAFRDSGWQSAPGNNRCSKRGSRGWAWGASSSDENQSAAGQRIPATAAVVRTTCSRVRISGPHSSYV